MPRHEAPVVAATQARSAPPSRSAGGSHTCAVVDNGTVRCWGFGLLATVRPCGQARPLASTLNVTAGQPGEPSLAAVALGPGQRIGLSGNVVTHVVADLTGSFHP